MINAQLEFLESFINDLIDLRKLRDGKFALAKEPIDFASIISSVCDIFKHQARAKNIEISTQFRHTSLDSLKVFPILIGDKQRLKQILINLIKNALKFTHAGKIEIRAEFN